MEARGSKLMKSMPALPWGVPVSPPVSAAVNGTGGSGGSGSEGNVMNERERARGEETGAVGRKRTREEKDGGEVDEEMARTGGGGGAQEKKKQGVVPEVKFGDRVEVLWELDEEPIVRIQYSHSLMCFYMCISRTNTHIHSSSSRL